MAVPFFAAKVQREFFCGFWNGKMKKNERTADFEDRNYTKWKILRERYEMSSKKDVLFATWGRWYPDITQSKTERSGSDQ